MGHLEAGKSACLGSVMVTASHRLFLVHGSQGFRNSSGLIANHGRERTQRDLRRKGGKSSWRKGGLSLGCLVALAGSFAVLTAPSSVNEEELRDSQKGFVRVLMWRGWGGWRGWGDGGWAGRGVARHFLAGDAASPVSALEGSCSSGHTHAF